MQRWPPAKELAANMDTPRTADILGAAATAMFQRLLLPTWKSSKEKQWGGGCHMTQVCHPLHLSPCVNILMQKETDSSLSGKVSFPLPNMHQTLGLLRSG